MKQVNELTEKRSQIDYWKVVNIDKESNEIIMLDYVFNHGDGFKGATGTRFQPVSKAEYKEIMSKANVIDRIIDCGIISEKNRDMAEKLAAVYYKEMKESGELEDFCFDLSYRNEHWDKRLFVCFLLLFS